MPGSKANNYGAWTELFSPEWVAKFLEKLAQAGKLHGKSVLQHPQQENPTRDEDAGCIVNRNRFVLGPSAAGKSYIISEQMQQQYEQGVHVVIVDGTANGKTKKRHR